MVLVVLDHDGNRLKKGSLEALTRARDLAQALGGKVAGVLLAEEKAPVEEARKYVEVLYTATLGPYTAEKWAAGVLKAAEASGAKAVVAPSSRQSRAYLGRVAYALRAGLLEDTLESRVEGGEVHATRYAYLNRVTQRVKAALPVVLTVKPNTTPLAEPLPGEAEAVALSVPEVPTVEVLERLQEEKKGVSLTEADVVVADRLVPGLLLDELRPEVELVDAAKIPYGPARAQEEINRVLVDRALAGKAVVRLKGGDPYVFGRGGEELLACAAAGVPVTVVSGVTSAIAAPAGAGVPVTHRAVAHEFTVVSGHVPPDSPASMVRWEHLAGLRGTLAIMMGLKNLGAISATLVTHGRPADTPAVVVQEGTTGDQRTVRSTLGGVAVDVAAAGLRPPAVVLIGDVVGVLDT